MDTGKLKRIVDHPPPGFEQLCFVYRQAIGARTQAEARTAAAKQALARAQQELAQAEANLHRAVGYEKGLQDAVVALEPVLDPQDPAGTPAEGGVA